MSILMMFQLVSQYLIMAMGSALIVFLFLRYITYRSVRKNQIYFRSFTTAVDEILESDFRKKQVESVRDWISELMNLVLERLPDRGLRYDRDKNEGAISEGIQDFSKGNKNIILSVKQHADTFKSSHPPDYEELAARLLDQDRSWRVVLGFVGIPTLSRVLGILPGLFIVGGIFGTFIGITSALPQIANIDLSKLDASNSVLISFISDVAFAMNTSIAGIIFSVIATLLNTLFPIAHARDEIRRNLERSLELIWAHVNSHQLRYGEERMIEILQKINIGVQRSSLAPQRSPGGTPVRSIKKAA